MDVGMLQMTPVKAVGQIANVQEKTSDELKAQKPFSEFLVNSLKETNELQKNAEKMDLDLAAGKVNDISQVVMASEKAQIALNLTMSIRNKAVEAYQEIMRMQV